MTLSLGLPGGRIKITIYFRKCKFSSSTFKIVQANFVPPHMTSAKFVWMHWCVKSPSRSVEISPYKLCTASVFVIKMVLASVGSIESSKLSGKPRWLRGLDLLRLLLKCATFMFVCFSVGFKPFQYEISDFDFKLRSIQNMFLNKCQLDVNTYSGVTMKYPLAVW